jgi:hypothetical protein
MRSDVPTPVTLKEFELLKAVLVARNFPAGKHSGLRHLLAKRGCTSGCGTIGLIPQGTELPRSSARNPVEVSGHVFDTDGEPIGRVVLWLQDGLLDFLEVHWYDSPIPLPAVRSVQWQL